MFSWFKRLAKDTWALPELRYFSHKRQQKKYLKRRTNKDFRRLFNKIKIEED